MDYLSSSEMADVDRYAVEELGIPEAKLMELAGLRTAEIIRENFESQKIRVFAGRGNNGGDAVSAARFLKSFGFEPIISTVGEPLKELLRELEIADNLDIQRKGYGDDIESELVLDGLLGYGIKGDPRQPLAGVIREINDSDTEVVSLDVPSGLDPKSGREMSPTVEADINISLAAPKHGIEDSSLENYLAFISIPEEAFRSVGREKSSQLSEKPFFRIK